MQIRRSSDNAIIKTYTVGNVLKKSVTVLPANGANYKWRVRAGDASEWGQWSVYRTFTNPYGGFNINFGTNHSSTYQGFTRRPSTHWKLGSNTMYTSGTANLWRSAHYGNVYYRDLDYSVRMRRTESGSNPNYIVVRSGLTFKSGSHLWYPGYAFGYRNDGQYRIIRQNADGTTTSIQGWTNSSHINKFVYNTLRVRAVGNQFEFYINGELVKTFTDSTRKYGGVGVTALFSGGGRLDIDRASLTRPSTSSMSDEPETIDAEQQVFNEEAQQRGESQMEDDELLE